MQDLLAALFWIVMGSGILAALPSARAAAIELFAIGGVTITHESVALTVRAVNDDGDDERLLFFLWNWSSQSTLSCLFVPLPYCVMQSSCSRLRHSRLMISCPLQVDSWQHYV